MQRAHDVLRSAKKGRPALVLLSALTSLAASPVIGFGPASASPDTLILDSGSTVTTTDAGDDFDTLILNGSGTGSADFLNFESLEMDGATWSLSGAIPLNGLSSFTTITNGTLLIDGSLTSSTVTITPGAAFGGSGTVTGDIINAGRLDTTTGTGVFTILGDLTFQSGSTLAARLGDGTSTYAQVSGNVIINDAANIVLSGDLSQDTAFTVLKSDGVISGSFDKVLNEDGNQLFFAALSTPSEAGVMKVATVGVSQVVHQAATSVTLDTHRGLLNTIHARIDHRYRDAASNGAPRNNVRGSRLAASPDTRPGDTSSLTLMSAVMNKAQTSLWPINLAQAVEKDPATPGFIADMLASERSDAESMRRKLSAVPRLQISTNFGGMWLEGFGMTSRQNATATLTGYEASAGGASVGLDSKMADNWAFGGMVGYGVSDADLLKNAGGLTGNNVYTGIYMSNLSRTHFANLFVTAAVTTFDAERAVTDGTAKAMAKDEFGGYMWDARLELGRTFELSLDNFIRPNVAIEYISAFQDDYTDDGAGLVPGLTINDHTTNILRTEGQVDVLLGTGSIDDKGWSLRAHIGAAHEIFLSDMSTDAWLTGFIDPLTLSRGEDHRTFAMGGASFSIAMTQRMRAQISFQRESNDDFARNNLVAGFTVAW